MRTRTISLLAAALLVFSAGSASAYAINMNVRGGLQATYTSSDTVIIDVFLDAPAPGITFLTVNVISDLSSMSYNGPASAVLPIIHPAPPPIYGTTGAQPGYILYALTPTGMPLTITALYPQQSPNWLNWPAPPPGKEVVNINYFEPSVLQQTAGTGNNIWIASLVYHIFGPGGTISLALDPSLGGTLSQFDGTQIIDLGATLGPDIFFDIPEPTTALLIGFGLLGLGLAGRRKL